MSKMIAIVAILICGIAIFVLLLISTRLYKNRIFKFICWFFALLISASTLFGIITSLYTPEQSIAAHTEFHGVTPLSPPPNIITMTGSNATTVVSLRGDTGAQLWQYNLDANSTAQNTTIDGNAVYSIVHNNTTQLFSVIALRADNGHQLWHLDLTPGKLHLPLADTDIHTSNPTIANNMLYLNINYGQSEIALCAFHANNGSLLKCALLDRHNVAQPQATPTPTSELQMINTIGLPQMSRSQPPLPLPQAPVVSGNIVLVEPLYSQPVRLQAFAGDTLSPVWSYQLSNGATNSNNGPIIGANEFFYIYDNATQQIEALNPTDGKVAWIIPGLIPDSSAEVGTPTSSPQTVLPILTSTHLYLYNSLYNQGERLIVTAFELQTGQKDWQQQLPIAVTDSNKPVETDNTLYISLYAGRLMRLDTTTGHLKDDFTLPPLQIQNKICGVESVTGISVLHNVLFASVQYANISTPNRSIFNFSLSNDPCNGVMSVSAVSTLDSFTYWNYIFTGTNNQNAPVNIQNEVP